MPAAKLETGAHVRLADRPATAADAKNRIFYEHYRNLTGTVRRVYGEEAWVEIDRDALPAHILQRHAQSENAMKKRWLDGLSDEARNRLTPEEKRFFLRYSVLVATNDLTVLRAAPEKPAA